MLILINAAATFINLACWIGSGNSLSAFVCGVSATVTVLLVAEHEGWRW